MSAVALQSFGFGDQLVRVFDRDGSAWFVANDVCGALELANPRHAVSRLEEDEKDDVGISDAIGRTQQTTIVSLSGVYALIFTSRKAAAKQFRRWVTAEVLPALMTTGRYEMPEAGNDDECPVTGIPGFRTSAEVNATWVAIGAVRRMARMRGEREAYALWRRLGLPEGEAPKAIEAPNRLPPQAWAQVWQWAEECGVSVSTGDGTDKLAAWRDFEAWAASKGLRCCEVAKFTARICDLFEVGSKRGRLPIHIAKPHLRE